MDYENFYESLRYHVGKKGHGGQSLICRHTDIPKSYLSRIMKKDRRAGTRTQKKISRFFGFGLEEFVEIGRRITLGEDPAQAVDLLGDLPEEQLIQRLTEAVRKEMVTARLLDRTQLLYADIVENSRQMIVRFDAGQKITFVNRAGVQMSGKERADLLNRDWKFLVREEFREQLAAKIKPLKGEGGSFSVEVPSSAGEIWLLLTVTIFPAGEGEHDLGQLVGFDITEQKKLVDRLHFIQHGVEMSFVPTLVIDDNAGIVYVNKAVCNLLGYNKEELTAMSVWDINPTISRESWPRKWAWFEAEENVVFPGLYRRKNGETIPVEFQVSNLKYPDGRRYNVVFVKPGNGEKFA
ncbi:MAG: PAS domain S-box protein [Proteobacteria bacterium]|nr:PAS domain S-box protein [Pseudomonadota bacterium]MBU1715972.1 PAS domain S-box protein [Pseudomonadota bacterium]